MEVPAEVAALIADHIHGDVRQIAGALNRFLRWDASATVDTLDRFAVPLHVHDGDGQAPMKISNPLFETSSRKQ